MGVSRRCALPQQSRHYGICHGKNHQGNYVRNKQDQHRERPSGGVRAPDLVTAHDASHLSGPPDHQLHGREAHGAHPDDANSVARPAGRHARLQGKGHHEEAVYSDGHVSEHGGRHGQVLHEEHQRTHGRREYPGAGHDVGEGEGHAEQRHDEVSRGQIDEERTDVGTAAAPAREDDHHQNVADDGEENSEGIEDNERSLGTVREADLFPAGGQVLAAASGFTAADVEV